MTERRIRTSYSLEPQGEEGTLPQTFSLRRKMEHQSRRKGAVTWVTDSAFPWEQPVEIAVLTRRQAAALIADAASNLAYEGV